MHLVQSTKSYPHRQFIVIGSCTDEAELLCQPRKSTSWKESKKKKTFFTSSTFKTHISPIHTTWWKATRQLIYSCFLFYSWVSKALRWLQTLPALHCVLINPARQQIYQTMTPPTQVQVIWYARILNSKVQKPRRKVANGSSAWTVKRAALQKILVIKVTMRRMCFGSYYYYYYYCSYTHLSAL